MSPSKFLDGLNPRGCLLVAIPPDGGRVEARTFRAGEEAQRDAWVAERDGRLNVYFAANPPCRVMNKKPTKEDVVGADWLYVDLDPHAGEDWESERARLHDLLDDFEPRPTAIIDSGNGYQSLWRLRERIPFRSAADALEYERHNRRLENVLGGDHCHNADRILRLPGTMNLPNERKRKNGRVPRRSALARANWDLAYELSDLDHLGALPEADKSKGAEIAVAISNSLPRVNVKALPLDERWRIIAVMGHDPGDESLHPTRSHTVFAVACQLVRGGADDDLIAAVLLDPDLGVSAHVREQRRPLAYATRQIRNARQRVMSNG